MSKNNSLTTLRKSGASATQTSLRGVHYLEKPKELTNIEDITTELVEDNQRRLNDVGGGIGRFLNFF
ncbi:MAG: hypothetical protein ISQ34_04460 [Rickettsiales bacterium]|nr:hypothetical protein [Rickettsiales bacterium]